MLVCRTCLTKEDLCPLFGELSAERFDSIQLLKATGIQIKENDGLPQAVCESCLKIIKIVLNFKEISEKTDEILRNMNIKIENDYQEFRSIYDDVINGNESENPFLNYLDIKNHCKNPIDDPTDDPIDDPTDDPIDDPTDDPIDDPIDNKNPKEDTKVTKTKTKQRSNEIDKKIETLMLYNGLPICNLRKQNLKHESNSESTKANRKITKKISNVKFNAKLTIDDLESSDSDNKKPYLKFNANLTIDDLESSDSDATFGKKDLVVKMPSKKAVTVANFSKYLRITKMPQKRKTFAEIQKMNETYMALAVRPSGPHNKGPIECKKCHEQLRDRPNFLRHARRHFEPEFACEVCGKKFHSRNHMGYHQQRRHGRTKRLACEQCGFRAVDKVTLMNHVRLEHTGERPYTCAECGMSFRMRRGIVQHMQTHFGATDRQQCDRCPAMYKSLSRLWSHRDRVHLYTYTYPCYLCTDVFRSSPVLRKHLLNSHGVPRDQQLQIKCVKIKKIEKPLK